MKLTVYLHWDTKVAQLNVEGTMTGAEFRTYLSEWSDDPLFAKDSDLALKVGAKDLDLEKQLTQQCVSDSITIKCVFVSQQSFVLRVLPVKEPEVFVPAARIQAFNAAAVEPKRLRF
jgi:hypothetical protein